MFSIALGSSLPFAAPRWNVYNGTVNFERVLEVLLTEFDRQPQELADIERLMSLYGSKLDWKRVEEYYDIFGFGEEAQRLRKRFGRAHFTFLTTMSRLNPKPAAPRVFVPYKEVKI